MPPGGLSSEKPATLTRSTTDLDAAWGAQPGKTRYLDQISLASATTQVIEYTDETFGTVKSRSLIVAIDETTSRVTTDLDAAWGAQPGKTRYLDQISVGSATTKVIEYTDETFGTVKSRSLIVAIDETTSRVTTDLDAAWGAQPGKTRYLDQISLDSATTKVIEYTDETFGTVKSRSLIVAIDETASRVATDLDAAWGAQPGKTRYLDQISVDSATTKVIEYTDETFGTVKSRSLIVVIDETTSRVTTDLDAAWQAQPGKTRYLDQISVDSATTQVIEYTDETFGTVKSRSLIVAIDETTSRVTTDLDAAWQAQPGKTRYLDQISVDSATTQVIEYTDETFGTVKSRSLIVAIDETTSRVTTDLDAAWQAQPGKTRYLDQISVDSATTKVIEYTDETFGTVKTRSLIVAMDETTSRVTTD